MPTEPPERTALFAHARSGSTSLYHVLQLHPRLNFALEPFYEKYAEWNPHEKNYIDLIDDVESLDQALDELFSTYNGIKILNYQLPQELYTHLLLSPRLKIIFLRRRNLLQAAISGWIAKQTSVWQISDMNEEAEAIYRRLQPAPLDRVAEGLAYDRDLRDYYGEAIRRRPRGTYLEVIYEDLYSAEVAANREAARKIFQFLGLDLPQSKRLDFFLDPQTAKINSADRYALVPNAKEIDEHFGNDDTGWLFELGPNRS